MNILERKIDLINYEVYEKEIEKGNIINGYIFCGLDEEFIKEGINLIVKKKINDEVKELNLIKIDGVNVNFDIIMNVCEIMFFMSEKKVVLIYRVNFLYDKSDLVGIKLYNDIKKYIFNILLYIILVMYYLFKDKREKLNKNKKIIVLSKFVLIVYCDKLKKDRYIKKIGEIFKEKGKVIGRIELIYFLEKV